MQKMKCPLTKWQVSKWNSVNYNGIIFPARSNRSTTKERMKYTLNWQVFGPNEHESMPFCSTIDWSYHIVCPLLICSLELCSFIELRTPKLLSTHREILSLVALTIDSYFPCTGLNSSLDVFIFKIYNCSLFRPGIKYQLRYK